MLQTPPSPRLKNVYIFSGEKPTLDEWGMVFRGNPLFLRRVAELALGDELTQPHPTPEAPFTDRKVVNG